MSARGVESVREDNGIDFEGGLLFVETQAAIMGDSDTANLIDLSLSLEENGQNPSAVPAVASAPLRTSFISELPTQRRDSLDNNPFDCVQNLVNRPVDPFEIVEKEACYKAHRNTLPPVEVKLGNLLSLSDDNLLDEEDTPSKYEDSSPDYGGNVPKFGSDSTMASVASTIYHSADDLDTESPPVAISSKWTPESGGVTPSDSGGYSTEGSAGVSAKSKKALEYRKRLLKLSISNSTFNSPVSRRAAMRNDSESDNNSSPMLQQPARYEEPMISAESPLKLVDDDLMSEEPPLLIESEKDFDADLEMLRIPMLKGLPSPIVEDSAALHAPEDKGDSSISSRTDNISTVGALPNLEVLRAKLKARREEAHNNKDISFLIKNLKTLICDIGAVDDVKKREASSLLESLSSAISDKETMAGEQEQHAATLTVPQPIVRQGTFDIELQENEEKEKQSQQQQHSSECTNSQMTLSTHPVPPMPATEIPDVMFKSSATYDGDTGEASDLVLPHIESQSAHSSLATQAPSTDVSDIIEQLSRLLEQHQLAQHLQSESADGTAANQGGSMGMNPTFIVVMNSSQAPTQNHAAAEHSFNEDSGDLYNSSAAIRRRSQSLSIHDKVKIVQLPMHGPVHAAAEQESSPPVRTPPLQNDAPEFKTPSRMMMRRNSFSSGTPYTPMLPNCSGAALAARRAYGIESASARRTSILETTRERQQHAIVKPMPLPHTNVSAFKPDLRKKLKSNAACTDSIMKSSGPLKATIPVKKVAPMLKHSPPTPERLVAGVGKSNLNSSMHLLTKSGKMSYTSTPMPLSRSAGTLGITGYPNACSTPTVHDRSPVRQMNRPRYSYGGATPGLKLNSSCSTSAAASGLKRRTLTELKAKSPMKSRLSSVGGATAASAAAKAVATKTTTSKLTNNSFRAGGNKLHTSTVTARVGTTPRVGTRTSMSGPMTSAKKNKENKQP